MPLKLRRGGRDAVDKMLTAHIKLLDNTVIDINVPLNAKGRDCLQKIGQLTGLHETDFFGLQFLTKKEKLRWIDLDKPLKKQLDRYSARRGRTALLVFKVQYFVVNIHALRQEITRYLYYLQLKTLILNGKLKCKLHEALKLGSFAMQAELGGYDPEIHSLSFLSDFLLLPTYLTENENVDELHKEIALLYKENSGLSVSSAEKAYIQLCQQLDGYGVEFFNAKDKDGIEIEIGACYDGIKILYTNREKPNILFRWQDIGNMAFNRQQFVVLNTKSNQNLTAQMEDLESSKYLWKLCVSQHQFFRLSHNTIGKSAFRTQNEVSTDPNLFIKIQQTPGISRRMTLTKRQMKKTQKFSARSSGSSNGRNEQGVENSVSNSLVDDSVDETEFLHRYEDICRLARERRGSSTTTTSRGSTPASSEYNTSDSDSEVDFRQFSVQPVAPQANGSSGYRPVSLIFTRLSKIGMQHRDELLRHLEGLRDDNQLDSEYGEIFMKKAESDCSTAIENMVANRSDAVLPYEDNRVLLNPNNNYEATNYINASPIHMNIGKDQLAFVVAQSPLKETTNNFWQMIWEKNICVVAMVSKEVEGEISKCWRYWPDDHNNSNVTFGQISVKTNFNNFFAAYSIRSLQIQHVASKQSRTVFQIQYIQWPEDGGVPMWTKPFIEFLEEIHSLRKASAEMNGHLEEQETLIHCEDGGGRSGVVILAEMLLGMIEHNETLDVPMTLAKLRSQRMNLVSSVDQYRFVYQLLIDYLKRNRLI
ncbi:tyrosine-protein phosphatase non-receptor type 21-like [Hydractinia symbiolongicarpus]|uniref:tyrosine-protein phosphatase non-receptor type 21-like n=1 Tax=Hydractinia symbiolongicarpus TaxID=13093 RepID=UPI00254E2A84|nr:tyrosine-protein phosphatase non-receptor type 21-like [Hydractinia symbiolongicarpus]